MLLFLLLRLTRLDTLRYFWPQTGRLAGTKRGLATNAAVLAPELSGFNAHRRVNSLPGKLTTTNDDRRNPATTTAVHRIVM